MTRVFGVVLFLALAAASVGGGRNDKLPDATALGGDLAEAQAFAESFYSDAHVGEYVAALDTLRHWARRDVYDGYSDVLERGAPELKTSNGVLMVYTIVSVSDTLHHHFSVSRAPYLPTAFGRTMVGLACLRLGLPAPEVIRLSPRQVFHAEWHMTPAQDAELAAREVAALPDPISLAAGQALVLAYSIVLERIDVDYEELQRGRSESSN